MDEKNRQDFSYELWGDPKLAEYDGSKVTFRMNPIYGEGVGIFITSEIAIYSSLLEYIMNFQLDKHVSYYKEQSMFLGKVIEGKFIVKAKNKDRILFNKGDIFCLSGNSTLDGKYHYRDKTKVKLVGIFCYHQEVIDAFKHNGWSTDSILELFENPELESGVLLNKTHDIEKIIDDLHNAMIDDDRFTAFVKAADLFRCFIRMMKNKEHTRGKAYTQQQFEEVIKIKTFLDDNLDKYYSMPELAEMFNISLSRIQSIFKEYYNMSPYKYHLEKRLEKANYLITNTEIKISIIAESLGFTSYDKFFKAYKNKYGYNPSKHRRV